MPGKLKFLFLLALAAPAAFAEIRLQSHESISAAITALIESDFRQRNQEYQAEPVKLDIRLQLPLCDRPLDAFFLPGRRESGFLSVGVRCEGGRPWTIYNKVQVKAFREVVILKNAVRQGSVLTEADLGLEKRDLAELRGGYFTSLGQTVNRPVKRTLPAGTVLSPEWLSVSKMVRRGQKVIIRAESSHFAVNMSGQALADGEAGQRIRVRNDQSARIVEGTVMGPGLVLIGL
ncbi:flagellar basal body P-ring formation chaperone FlgA [Methylocaldum sp.]|uniref:flagellar basal body P-ring formation chaperone FlgA n=1 Tax=Methylocaldum sp. TaxID=1969727 RepID=UPI002D4CF37A|nr:flagellar basal body P-ring formation chaperone FlgA [Methylocaldum sp.]HYE33922.1 flagellar basal body P-ring formation chaperone FlgA [Methylocaldum sp.]